MTNVMHQGSKAIIGQNYVRTLKIFLRAPTAREDWTAYGRTAWRPYGWRPLLGFDGTTSHT